MSKIDSLKGISVENMVSSRGNDIPNQFVIYTPEGTVFQSYTSIIAIKHHKGGVILDKNRWDYSKTTGKYRNIFLGENRKETERKIEEGVYKLEDLNNG